MQTLVLIACTAVLLAAGTTCNAASFVNSDQSQIQYDAMEIKDAELSTQITEKQPPPPFPCTPEYDNMVATEPKNILEVESPGPICFAANGDFAVPAILGFLQFLIFDKNGNFKKEGNYPLEARGIDGCAFSLTALYFADESARKIYKYTPNGEYVGTFVTGFAFGRLAAAHGNLYAIVHRSEATVIAFNETNGQETCSIKTSLRDATSLAFDTQENLNVALRENTIEAHTLDCKFVNSRVYPEIGYIGGLAFDGSGNNVILDWYARSVMVYSPPPSSSLIKWLGPNSGSIPVDVGIGKDCLLYVVDVNNRVVYAY